MEKKLAIILMAFAAFILGQIFLESALTAAGAPEKTFAEFLVPVFELVAGGVLGFFYKKISDDELIAEYETQYSDTKAEMVHLENQLNKLKKPAKKKAVKVS